MSLANCIRSHSQGGTQLYLHFILQRLFFRQKMLVYKIAEIFTKRKIER